MTYSPHLLLAVPQMQDPHFSKGVVLLLHHDSKGAFGLLLNQPSPIDLSYFAKAEKMQLMETKESEKVFWGGPVQRERGFVLHEDSSIEEKNEILPGIYLSSSKTSLERIFYSSQSAFRFILGYSGWGEGQLEEELKAGGWLMFAAEGLPLLTTEPENLWDYLLKKHGIKDISQLAMGGGFH